MSLLSNWDALIAKEIEIFTQRKDDFTARATTITENLTTLNAIASPDEAVTDMISQLNAQATNMSELIASCDAKITMITNCVDSGDRTTLDSILQLFGVNSLNMVRRYICRNGFTALKNAYNGYVTAGLSNPQMLLILTNMVQS